MTSPPQVLLGGRWKALEDQNAELSDSLKIQCQALHDVETRLKAALKKQTELEAEVQVALDRRAESERSLSQTRGELSEAQSKLSETNECLREAENDRSSLREQIACLNQVKTDLTSKLLGAETQSEEIQRRLDLEESRLARECCLREEAEKRAKMLEQELSAAAATIEGKGKHVEMLLRDKERLWSQLTQLRRSNGNKTNTSQVREKSNNSSVACESVKEKKEKAVSCSSGSSHISRARRPGSTGTCGRVRRAGYNGAGHQDGNSSSGDLERRIWQLERCLACERKNHEQTRALLADTIAKEAIVVEQEM